MAPKESSTFDESFWSKLLDDGALWRWEKGNSAKVCVDGQEYFSSLLEDLKLAKREVLFMGWDFHGDVILNPSAPSDSQVKLRPFLKSLLKSHKKMHIKILAWDYAELYTLSREAFPRLKWQWTSPPRLDFRFDGHHAVGGAHHQKIVIIDRQVVYVGGLDVTTERWDTTAHEKKNSLRVDSAGDSYGPFHDMQVRCRGPIVGSFVAFFDHQWTKDEEEPLPLSESEVVLDESLLHQGENDAEIFFEDVNMGIARTIGFGEDDEVQEIEKLYIDLIKSAKDYIYIENQYFTSQSLAEAIGKRLEEDSPPLVTLVLPRDWSGWVEEKGMGTLQNGALSYLRSLDRHQRLQVFSPQIDRDTPVKVHAKLLIVDDMWLRIGSSNTANRSMGLDTEVDVLIEGGGKGETVIKKLLLKLLSHWFEEASFSGEENSRDVLEGLSKMVQEDSRSLVPLKFDQDLDEWKAYQEAALWDMERPARVDRAFKSLFKGRLFENIETDPIRILSVTTTLIILGLGFWKGYQLDWDLESIVELIRKSENTSVGPLWVLLIFLLSAPLFVPLTILLLACATLFPEIQALFYFIGGALLSGLLGYAFGKVLQPRGLVNRFQNRYEGLQSYLKEYGTLGVMLIRLVPVAPYTVINIFAGVFRVPLLPYVLGTTLGLLPGALFVVFLKSTVVSFVEDPSSQGFLLLLVVVGIYAGMVWYLTRRYRKRKREAD